MKRKLVEEVVASNTEGDNGKGNMDQIHNT